MDLEEFTALLRQARFQTSAPNLAQCPAAAGCEIAFAGRSNAGKSSAMNALVDHGGLARTSKTPGRTQLINFFQINTQWRLVDLPGYGYAKVPERLKQEWQANMGEYLEKRSVLAGLILVMDCRHPLKAFDQMMLDWAGHYDLPVHILLSKADKLSRGQGQKTLLAVRKEVDSGTGVLSVQLFSALKKTGVEQARALLYRWFAAANDSVA